MAGTINLALSQQFDMDGEPLGGGLLYFFAAGTTTPQSAFQDTGLTIVHPNPIVLDASGRVPMFYLADGSIKIRLTDDSGVTVIAADNLLVIGPSSGGPSGGGVDPNTVLQTGDIKARFGTGTLPGFLPCNGSTMGSGTSGSTYAAAENQALFEYLWSTTVLQVFAGATPSRGATANADWVANKRMTLPDLRGRTIAGMDDMGAAADGRLSSTYFGGVSATILGNAAGQQSKQIVADDLAAHSHSITNTLSIATNTVAHTHGGGTLETIGRSPRGGNASLAPTTANTGATVDRNLTGTTAAIYTSAEFSSFFVGNSNASGEWVGATGAASDTTHGHTLNGSVSVGNNTTTNATWSLINPMMVMTIYIKL